MTDSPDFSLRLASTEIRSSDFLIKESIWIESSVSRSIVPSVKHTFKHRKCIYSYFFLAHPNLKFLWSQEILASTLPFWMRGALSKDKWRCTWLTQERKPYCFRSGSDCAWSGLRSPEWSTLVSSSVVTGHPQRMTRQLLVRFIKYFCASVIIKLLLTISIDFQEDKWWEYRNSSTRRDCLDVLPILRTSRQLRRKLRPLALLFCAHFRWVGFSDVFFSTLFRFFWRA